MRSNNLVEFTNNYLPKDDLLLFSISANFQKSDLSKEFKSTFRGELILTNKELIFFKKNKFKKLGYQISLKAINFISCTKGLRGSALIVKTDKHEYSFDLLKKDKVPEFISAFEKETNLKTNIPEQKNNIYLKGFQIFFSLALLGFIISSVLTDVEPVIERIKQSQE